MKQNVLCNHRSNGGLDMIDLKCFQSSFLLSWAQQLLHSEDAEWKFIAFESLKKVGGRAAFESMVDSKIFKGLYLIKNSFWREVLCCFLDNKSNECMHDITSETPLFNNINLTFRNKPLFFPLCIQKGIMYVKDMFIGNSIISFDRFKALYDRADALLVYKCIFNALSQKIQIIKFNLISNKSPIYFKSIDIATITRKNFYMLIKSSEPPTVENWWSRRLNSDFNQQCWALPFQVTKETRLQALQWKILMNIYPTAITLNRMKINNSDQCMHCNSRDTIEHFFFLCPKLSRFWIYVENTISFHVNHRISLQWKDAILGVTSHDSLSRQKLNLFNLILLISKLSVSKYKYGSRQDPCVILEHELRIRNIM